MNKNLIGKKVAAVILLIAFVIKHKICCRSCTNQRCQKMRNKVYCRNFVIIKNASETNELHQILIDNPMAFVKQCTSSVNYNNVLIISYADRDCRYCNSTFNQLRRYSKIHGYNILLLHTTKRPKSLDARWEKVFVLQRLLSEYSISTVFVWIDPDVLIIDLNIILDPFFSLLEKFDLIILHNVTLQDPLSLIKPGIYVVKNTFTTKLLLNNAIKLAKQAILNEKSRFQQAVLSYTFAEFVVEKMLYVPTNLVQAYCCRPCTSDSIRNLFKQYPFAINFATVEHYRKQKLILTSLNMLSK